ncbi:MAG: phenylalanine--tRNA ligase subunit beta, partial [Oscillibacter sp.]|nr:phenylalanine--tRNA ligase subunit beta [Oscillibacter sp.]
KVAGGHDGGPMPEEGMAIKAGKLRGVESNGMMCSIEELGSTKDFYPEQPENGLYIFAPDSGVKPGDDAAEALGLHDTVFEFEVTSNRVDCYAMTGIAREAAATFGKALTLPEETVHETEENCSDYIKVEVRDADLCTRYCGRVCTDITIAPSPKWMQRRLASCGIRPINNLVDITNYVMLEYGQPMHAFDFSCVDGGKIVVRPAREGETIQTLDGTVRNLTPDMLCICDAEKPVCVAGVMGGANSEIIGDTDMVLFESANFNGASVRRTAVALNMRTEASSRYEKGLDPMNTFRAVQRACELVEQLDAGEVVEGLLDVIAADRPPVTLKLEPDKINRLLGTEISSDEMRRILTSLEFKLDGNSVSVPSWRGDVEHYSDLAEEVARFHGYNEIPDTLSSGINARRGFNPEQKAERLLGQICRACGYSEIITYSFISPTAYDKIRLPADSPLRKSLKILNPLGEDRSIMRTTILPSMLEILTRNWNYRNKSVKLYELGRTYFPRADGLADEPKTLCLGAYGPDMDFFTLKGAVEAVLNGLRIPEVSYTAQGTNPSYHPGRCADIYSGDKFLGVLGQIHPTVAATYGIDAELYTAELSLDALLSCAGPEPVYQPLPRFPSVPRDLALVCDKALPVAELRDAIRQSGSELLKSVALFDIYTGPGIPPDKKSVAFNLTFRSDERSLTAAEVEEAVARILDALRDSLNAVLR